MSRNTQKGHQLCHINRLTFDVLRIHFDVLRTKRWAMTVSLLQNGILPSNYLLWFTVSLLWVTVLWRPASLNRQHLSWNKTLGLSDLAEHLAALITYRRNMGKRGGKEERGRRTGIQVTGKLTYWKLKNKFQNSKTSRYLAVTKNNINNK